MRREDLDKLQQPYTDGPEIPERFANALGVVLPAVRELEREVFADFDETKYGIGWWSPHPGTSRRILISDHLIQCIDSIETNLVEARLHLVELRDFDDQFDRFIAHAVKHDRQGRPSISMPPSEKAADDLPHLMAAVHIAGFFRAVGSALDCLGAAIIGVLALPISLLKADLDKAIIALGKVKSPNTDGQKLQVAFGAKMSIFVTGAGPVGWLPWTTDYRNMLVHRGRRLQVSLLARREPVRFSADGRPIMLARSVRQLAQAPGLSQVDGFLSAIAPVLTEDATTTLEGVMASALMLIEGVAASLVEIWRQRRAEPTLLSQPKEQWPEGRSTASRGFPGYRPGSVPFNIDTLVSHPTFVRRLQVAALGKSARKKWDTFD